MTALLFLGGLAVATAASVLALVARRDRAHRSASGGDAAGLAAEWHRNDATRHTTVVHRGDDFGG